MKKQLFNYRYFCYFLMIISLVSSLRNLVLPLVFDELQYAEIGKNIITKGEYSLFGTPSTFTPVLPFIVGLFYMKSFPAFGFLLVKLTNLILMLIGLRYCFLFLRKLNLSPNIILSIILVSVVNNAFVTWSTVIYPESILFFSFWMFMYYSSQERINERQVLFASISLMLLIITRYVYAVLLLIIAYILLRYIFNLYKEKKYYSISRVALIAFISFLPLLIWFKYVFSIETEVNLNQSYFSRYKDNDLLYNIKAGLGFIKHNEVDKVNGIPAFLSLFVPVTGLRNWIVSFVMIVFIMIGLLSKWSSQKYRMIAISIILIMLGLIMAGTGFSRYWLVLLPGFWLGIFQIFNLLKINEKYFMFFVIILSTLYVINEVRLDYIILNRFYQ